MAESSPDNKTWSLIAGLVIIGLSLWALHRFCDVYTESLVTRQVVPGIVEDEPPPAMPAGPVCSKWLGAISGVGGLGAICLLGSWLLSLLSHSRGLLRLSAKLAVAGRLIALGSLGTVVLVVVLFNLY